MKHPYVGKPPRQFWKRAPGVERPHDLDPAPAMPFQIARTDRIVTAGSCFAQHVARWLARQGFNHLVTEPAHPLVPTEVAEAHHYGQFSARYGNVYTGRQLRQLVDRAWGRFEPVADAWDAPGGDGVVDPFRPQIQPGGYADTAELDADRTQHLAAVRAALEQADVFVFTLGLTEAWCDRRDGAVFPLAPGVAGGRYDPETFAFHNFDEVETHADIAAALTAIRAVNPTVRIILTVSPVPLAATYEDRHVLVSTTWSKAVLRIVAERLTREFDDCVYFPSYEIITSPHVAGRYYAPDRREVLPRGVQHVMRVFRRAFTSDGDAPAGKAKDDADSAARAHLRGMEAAMEALCDEASIDNV